MLLMSPNIIARHALKVWLLSFTSFCFALPNPPTQDPLRLTSTDWASVCTSGSPKSTTGCLGNAASVAFQKINSLTNWFTDWVNVVPQNVANSVFIQQYGGDSSLPLPASNYATVSAIAPGGLVACDVFTENGVPIGGTGVDTSGTTSGLQVTGAIATIANSMNTSSLAGLRLTSSGATSANLKNPVYLLCIGLALPRSKGTLISLAGTRAS